MTVQKLFPRPHQHEALQAVHAEMLIADRATVVMACGTGKTLVEMWAAEALKPARVLVLVPTLNLLQQAFHDWREQQGWGEGYRTLCVCSDSAIGSSINEPADSAADELQFLAGDLDFPTSTDPANVNSFLDAAAPGTTSVIFCTYQSAAVVGAALGRRPATDASIDVGIFDEAHKTVGDAGRAFSYCLTDRNIRLNKRLFFTATPRVMDSAGNRDEDGELSILSMDDEAAYGKRVYELGFAEAARRKLIVPYKVIISVVNDRDISSEQLRASMVDVGGMPVDASMVANRIALASAVERFGIRKAITFHRTVEEARVFSLLPDIVANGALEGFERLHVSGSQTPRHRNEQISRFEACDQGSISNAKCLTEGIDLPAVDLVAFMSPKESKVDIVQAAGRSMRLAGPDKTTGYILLPIHVNPELGESVNDAVQRSDFKTVFDVLRALMANDSELDYLVRNTGEIEGAELERSQYLGGRVEFVGGSTFMDAREIFDSIETRLFHGITQGEVPFDVRLAHLAAFKAANGHCDVPYRYGQLGTWCGNERKKTRKQDYPDDRRQRLIAIGFRFDANVFEQRFDEKMAELAAFKAVNGHCDVSSSSSYVALGRWCGTQRKEARQPDYPDDRRQRLVAIGFRFDANLFEDRFDEKMVELAAFKATNGHCDVLPSYSPLGKWCCVQRAAAREPDYPDDRRRRLVAMGFRFETGARDQKFESKIEELAAFKAANGHCNVPKTYGPLGRWCGTQRAADKEPDYPDDRRRRLVAMGFRFETDLRDQKFESKMVELAAFKAANGHCDVPKSYGKLNSWCCRQRKEAKKPDYSDDRRQCLVAMGFRFETDLRDQKFESKVSELAAFKAANGHCDVPSSSNFGALGRWCGTQRAADKEPDYPDDRRRRLVAMGFRFETDLRDQKFESKMVELAAFKAANGHCDVAQRHGQLGIWCANQRAQAKQPEYPVERRQRLVAMGFSFSRSHIVHNESISPALKTQTLGEWTKAQRAANPHLQVASTEESAQRLQKLEAFARTNPAPSA